MYTAYDWLSLRNLHLQHIISLGNWNAANILCLYEGKQIGEKKEKHAPERPSTVCSSELALSIANVVLLYEVIGLFESPFSQVSP